MPAASGTVSDGSGAGEPYASGMDCAFVFSGGPSLRLQFERFELESG